MSDLFYLWGGAHFGIHLVILRVYSKVYAPDSLLAVPGGVTEHRCGPGALNLWQPTGP